MQNEYRLSIITVNYNGLADTCALIDSITFTDDMEVIVVDNASKEDEAAIIARAYPRVHVVRSDKNLGFAGGNNLGIKASRGQYLLFINNDTILEDDWDAEALIARMEKSPKAGIVCPKIRFAWGDHPLQFTGYTPLSTITVRNHSIGFNEKDCAQYDTPHPTPYAHGAAMLVKREAMEDVGYMPECYFLYYEEFDWSMMFTRAGYEIWYEPACTIYHKESQATGQASPLKTYYLTRNRLLLIKRNFKSPSKYLSYIYIIGIVATRDLMKSLIRGQFSHAQATIRGVFHFLKM